MLSDTEAAHRPDVVVGIARGGIWPARMIASYLRRPLTIVTARHNATDQPRVQGSGEVAIDMINAGSIGTASRVLLVDDICGSGATLRVVIAALAEQAHPELIRTAALCRNLGSSYEPDRWVWDVEDWVAFPWEPPPDRPPAIERLPVPATVRGRS